MLRSPLSCLGSGIQAEAAAEALAYDNGLDTGRVVQTIVCRFGWSPRIPADVAAMRANMTAGDIKDEHGGNVYLSPGDAGRFGACCVEAALEADFRHAIVYCQSKAQPAYAPRFDVTGATALVGYAAEDTFPEGTDAVLNDVHYISNPALFDRVPLPSKNKD